MKIKFDKILNNIEGLKQFDRTNPYNVAALTIHTICNYDKDNDDNFYKMLQYLMGENQQISPMMKQNIKDRMLQNNKYPYIGKSYFVGSSNNNDYQPSIPYEIEVLENDYSKQNEGYIRLLLKSGGADNLRPITLRLAKDGNYYLWSDSIIGLLTDIKVPESNNPWA